MAATAPAAAAATAAPEEKNECVKVVVRMRPMNSDERERGEERAVDIDTKAGSVSVRIKYVLPPNHAFTEMSHYNPRNPK